MFSTKLHHNVQEKNSRVCVGLDPRLEWLPKPIIEQNIKKHGKTFEAAGHAITEFNRQVIDVVAPLVPAVKPQIAFYEQYGPAGLTAFWETIKYAKQQGLVVIVDAKRGDIDSTAQAYANSLLGKTDLFGTPTACYDVDCVTVNPFLGEDSLIPFINTCREFGKGIFVLAKTSNPGSGDFQDLSIDGQTITMRVADMISKHATISVNEDGYSNIGAVVGATFPQEAKEIRDKLPHSIFLVPGIGAQGGSIDTLTNFFDSDGLGAIVNSSREIVFSHRGEERRDYLEIIKENTKLMTENINQVLDK